MKSKLLPLCIVLIQPISALSYDTYICEDELRTGIYQYTGRKPEIGTFGEHEFQITVVGDYEKVLIEGGVVSCEFWGLGTFGSKKIPNNTMPVQCVNPKSGGYFTFDVMTFRFVRFEANFQGYVSNGSPGGADVVSAGKCVKKD